MNIAICEDDPTAQEKLATAIKDWAATRKTTADVFCYGNAEAFIMAWPDSTFDLIFLDIQMKNMTGIELAEHIRKTDHNLMIVFVTSFSQYVLKGYDVDALHYLIKPLSAAKLLPILDKAHLLWRARQNDAIVVTDGSGRHKIFLHDIFYISMSSHIAEIHTESKTYNLRKTAQELIESLPDMHFIRCHRSIIVNLFKVDCVFNGSLKLMNGEKLPVSRGTVKNVNDAFARLHMG